MNQTTHRKLKMLGMLLFLFGLIAGFAIMAVANPRMGLAAHLEGVMNGTFLVVAGFIWNELKINEKWKSAAMYALIYGTFANFVFTLLGAILGTSRMTPIAGSGYSGSELHETLVSAGLASVGITTVFSLVVIVYGLRGKMV